MDAFDRLAAEPIIHGPVKQHYVSRFYLNGFSENRRISVYDRTSGSFLSLPAKKVATLEHFFLSMTKVIVSASNSKHCLASLKAVLGRH